VTSEPDNNESTPPFWHLFSHLDCSPDPFLSDSLARHQLRLLQYNTWCVRANAIASGVCFHLDREKLAEKNDLNVSAVFLRQLFVLFPTGKNLKKPEVKKRAAKRW
jgi:hypothetical protein